MEVIPTKESFKHYMFFWSGQLFSLLGSMVVFFVLTFWLADVYGDPIISSFASFLYIMMMTICMPFAGVIADRIKYHISSRNYLSIYKYIYHIFSKL